jgi:hypothetical protein
MLDPESSSTDDPWWHLSQGEEWMDIDLPNGAMFRVHLANHFGERSDYMSYLALSHLFRELIWPCRDYCWNVAYRVVGNFDAAQDIAQVALIGAFYALGRLTRSSLRTLRVHPWLYKIVF